LKESKMAKLSLRCAASSDSNKRGGCFTLPVDPKFDSETDQIIPDSAMPIDPCKAGCKVMKYSEDGKYLAWNNGQIINIVKTDCGDKVFQQIRRPRCQFMTFSPKSTQVATWELYSVKKGTDSQGQGAPNVCIWSLETGELLHSWINRSHETWHPQWDDEETWMLRVVTNTIQFYDPKDYSKGVVKKLSVPGVRNFKVAPGTGPCVIATFVPVIKAAPASARLYRETNLDRQFVQKNFFKADKVDFKWNQQGSACLCCATTETDSTGKSYYGETNLYYLSVRDSDSVHVQLDKGGPVYDYNFSPDGNEFAVCYGFMPSTVKLFDRKCSKLFNFGSGHYNEVRFNPQGSIILMAGFGNLRGEMSFWNRKELTLINILQAPDTTTFDWSPDGEHVLTATCAPRLKVDNGIVMWHYATGQVYKAEFTELWEAKWQPALADTFPAKAVQVVKKNASGKPVNFVAPESKKYRPPGAVGTVSIKLHETNLGDAEKPKVEALSKTALKNKKKREAKAKLAANATFKATGVPERKKTADQLAAIAMVSEHSAPKVTVKAPESSISDMEKEIRKLNKKLRQIDALVEKKAAGETIQVNQEEKIKEKPEIEAEIAKLTKAL